ncbi:DUF1127 domain-containing protein [Shinella sp.]
MVVLRRDADELPIEEAQSMGASQRSQPLSMLDEHQLDDIGLTRKQASEVDKRSIARQKP